MSRKSLPEIPSSALRDYEASERVGSVWRRLKPALREQPPSARRVSSLAWAWAPALGALLFGSGVLVGARWLQPQSVPMLRAEPRPQAAPNLAPALAVSSREPDAATPSSKQSHSRGRRAASFNAAPSEPPSLAAEASSAHLGPTEAQALAPEWQRLVELGDFRGARRALDRQGGFDVAISRASPSELMSLVDIARAAGERNQAISALRQVLAHADAPEAPLAAWTLGNLLDQAGDQPGAALAFALYRRLSPAGDFAEDAAARQIDVALAENNAELVTQLVADYARDFPHGRRLSEFRRAERALVAAQQDAGAGAKSDAVANGVPDAIHDEAEDDESDVHAVGAAPDPSAAPPASAPRGPSAPPDDGAPSQ